MKISIAMATYNGSRYLQEQLDSFANQSRYPDELVVCDDCSSDNTLEILLEFASNALFPVRVYRNDHNLGFSNNFLKCVSLCQSEWIAFSDQDDIWLPDKLLKICQFINTNQSKNLVLICHSADLVDDHLNLTGRRLPDFPVNKIIERNGHHGFLCIAGFVISFKADLLSEIDSSLRPQDYFAAGDEYLSHDKWIPSLANALGEVAYISESLALYRRHSQAISGSYNYQTPSDRIKKALSVGVDFYKFQSSVAEDCSISYFKLSNLVTNDKKKNNLLIASNQYRSMSKIFKLREQLYDNKSIIKRILILYQLITTRGYFGNTFTSLGLPSLIKDIVVTFGLSLRDN